jgi:hypothetical protein
MHNLFWLSRLAAFGLAWLAALTVASEAVQECKWFGTKPFCNGHCPSGWTYTGKRESCTTGSRRQCCRQVASAPLPNAGPQTCRWFGREPFCNGQCPSGWIYTGRRESCTTGSKRYCCQTAASKAAAEKNAPVPPKLSVSTASPNSFIVRCTGLVPRAPLTIRVVDAALQWVMITSIGGTRLSADEHGACRVTLNGLCKRPGALHFSANDGRRNPADKTGTLWSNTVQVTCQ